MDIPSISDVIFIIVIIVVIITVILMINDVDRRGAVDYTRVQLRPVQKAKHQLGYFKLYRQHHVLFIVIAIYITNKVIIITNLQRQLSKIIHIIQNRVGFGPTICNNMQKQRFYSTSICKKNKVSVFSKEIHYK